MLIFHLPVFPTGSYYFCYCNDLTSPQGSIHLCLTLWDHVQCSVAFGRQGKHFAVLLKLCLSVLLSILLTHGHTGDVKVWKWSISLYSLLCLQRNLDFEEINKQDPLPYQPQPLHLYSDTVARNKWELLLLFGLKPQLDSSWVCKCFSMWVHVCTESIWTPEPTDSWTRVFGWPLLTPALSFSFLLCYVLTHT